MGCTTPYTGGGERLKGLIAAPFTPMLEDGLVNLDCIGAMAEHLHTHGVRGAFVCGTTGESVSLTVEERKAVLAAWIAVAPTGFDVIAHVGHPVLEDARELARHAEVIGARAIGAMPPSFFKPETLADLVEYCRTLCTAAPDIPFYYYHIPSMTHVNFSMVHFLEEAADVIPTLAGLKFTHEDLVEFDQCLTFENGSYDVLFGRDELLLPSLAMGGVGAVGSTYNFAAPVYHRLIQAFRDGEMDAARAEQRRANEIIQAFSRFGGLAPQKAIMALIGLDCGPVREPLRPLGADEIDALAEELERIGFFDLIETPVMLEV